MFKQMLFVLFLSALAMTATAQDGRTGAELAPLHHGEVQREEDGGELARGEQVQGGVLVVGAEADVACLAGLPGLPERLDRAAGAEDLPGLIHARHGVGLVKIEPVGAQLRQ